MNWISYFIISDFSLFGLYVIHLWLIWFPVHIFFNLINFFCLLFIITIFITVFVLNILYFYFIYCFWCNMCQTLFNAVTRVPELVVRPEAVSQRPAAATARDAASVGAPRLWQNCCRCGHGTGEDWALRYGHTKSNLAVASKRCCRIMLVSVHIKAERSSAAGRYLCRKPSVRLQPPS